MGHTVDKCIVVSHLKRVTACQENHVEQDIPWTDDRDFWWHEEMEDKEPACYPEWMDAEDPLFMLYTSGSTGKPKGVLHTTGGYLLYAATTFKIVFDYKPGDIYWCTADIGWITGHTTLCMDLANGASSVIFEGTPFYPDNDRYWAVIDKYKVNQFYTAPTAIRALMKFGDGPVLKHKLDHFESLGSVGEPINPEAWLWYYRYVGKERCSIVDTFWQTETEWSCHAPLPGCTPMKPGSAYEERIGPFAMPDVVQHAPAYQDAFRLVIYRTLAKMVDSLLDLSKCFEVINHLVNKAGEEFVCKQGDIDLVTETDKEVEQLLMNGIKEQFPDHKFIGEEESSAEGRPEAINRFPTWIIDPVDGTMNFVHAFPHSCISVGLVVNKVTELAIVYNPLLKQPLPLVEARVHFTMTSP
ncbi:Acetyl-coenzyme A synthetase [Eumeta japonica]|uniref:acetate--CoA ligase n=1 Tax=Eumeta variegata TaxID=151549 RepID=A0A4C1T5D6_EUMVA|nr:Acetyl-coenzyme A synthetase [Eumeta japonica]